MKNNITGKIKPDKIHISLIGFMGVGKSTVASLLAQMLGLKLHDTDKIIEHQNGISIPQMIEFKGEEYFRRCEAETIQSIVRTTSPSIIACGGGAILNGNSRQALSEYTNIILLSAHSETCVQRIDVTTRPLLSGHADPLKTAKEIFNARKEIYETIADISVNCEELTAEQVAKLIYEYISQTF